MAIFVVLWPYLLTTKLSCLQKNNFEHTILVNIPNLYCLYFVSRKKKIWINLIQTWYGSVAKASFLCKIFFCKLMTLNQQHIQAETFEVCHYLAKFPGVIWQKSPCIDLSVLEGHNWYVRKNDNGLPFSVARQCAMGWSYFCKK